jgi:hypothetical protein
MDPVQHRRVEIGKALGDQKQNPCTVFEFSQEHRREAFAVQVMYRRIFEENTGFAK